MRPETSAKGPKSEIEREWKMGHFTISTHILYKTTPARYRYEYCRNVQLEEGLTVFSGVQNIELCERTKEYSTAESCDRSDNSHITINAGPMELPGTDQYGTVEGKQKWQMVDNYRCHTAPIYLQYSCHSLS